MVLTHSPYVLVDVALCVLFGNTPNDIVGSKCRVYAQVLQPESTSAVMAVLNFTCIEDSKCKAQLLGHLGGEDYKEALDLTEPA